MPLSVLLASIMTYGAFAENYEFAAMKSTQDFTPTRFIRAHHFHFF